MILAELLAADIAKDTATRDVTVERRAMLSADADVLAERLSHTRHLISLKIHDTGIGTAGAAALINLAQTISLKTLSLPSNSIGGPGHGYEWTTYYLLPKAEPLPMISRS